MMLQDHKQLSIRHVPAEALIARLREHGSFRLREMELGDSTRHNLLHLSKKGTRQPVALVGLTAEHGRFNSKLLKVLPDSGIAAPLPKGVRIYQPQPAVEFARAEKSACIYHVERVSLRPRDRKPLHGWQ